MVMTIEAPIKSPDLNTVLFIRWLALNGRMGRVPEGKPAGELVMMVTSQKGRSAIDKLVLPRTLRQTIQETGDY